MTDRYGALSRSGTALKMPYSELNQTPLQPRAIASLRVVRSMSASHDRGFSTTPFSRMSFASSKQ